MINRIAWYFGVLWIFGLSIFAPNVVRAEETIGISPSSLQVKVFTEDAREEHVSITRSTTEGEMSFRVQLDDFSLLKIPDGTQFTLLAGEQIKKFPLLLDAHGVAPGIYKSQLIFTLLQPEEGQLSLNGAAVEFALRIDVTVEVLDRPDSSVALSLYDYPMLVAEVSAEDIKVTQSPGKEGRLITSTWNLVSSGENPLEGVMSSFRITRKEDIFFSDQFIHAPTIPALGTVGQSSEFILPNSYPSGKYIAHVVIDGREVTKEFWVIRPVLWLCISGFILSIAAVLWAIVAMPRRRSRTIKH
jgi:hypothetical protein